MLNLSTTELETVLSADPVQIAAHCGSLYDRVAGQLGERIVLFGAGFLGRRTLAGLRKKGIEPLGFADNNPSLWGTEVDGLQVVSRAEAEDRWAETATFVVTVFHGTPIREQLQKDGCPIVAPCPYLYWKHPEVFLPYGGVSRPQDTLNASDEVREGMRLWADRQSREVYLAQLQWRATLDYSILPEPSPTDETYFPPEIAEIEDEVFVDVGAFDGDSVQAFGERRNGRFTKAVAVEPDPANCAALKRRMAKLPFGDKVQIVNVGAASREGILQFEALGTAASTLTATGTTQVPCARLDDVLKDETPTYLKMDIEGAELDALHGAADTIRRCRPVLAICLYHKPGDLWTIPMYVDSLGMDYNYLLRAHSEECWELVLYAVPMSRYQPST
jgi:FkbM family methyltransferase